jgi:hypothetical protein
MRELNETFEIMKGIQLKKYYKAAPERREGIITDPNEILIKAVHNARPLMSIQNVRVGGSVYKVPGHYFLRLLLLIPIYLRSIIFPTDSIF